MRKFGLIGYPLAHSFSKKYFEQKFETEQITGCLYELYPLQTITELPALLSDPQLEGLNVTIPYKEAVMSYMDAIDADAKKIGAVNCIKKENGKWKGYNTDATGFKTSLLRLIAEPIKIEQAFVLGTGGSSKAVTFILKHLGIPFLKLSRLPGEDKHGYEEIELHLRTCNLFINTTPLGMFPNTTTAPSIPYEHITGKDFLFDLVYNPAETLFLKKGRERGAKTKNGLEMLEMQAEESWRIWNS